MKNFRDSNLSLADEFIFEKLIKNRRKEREAFPTVHVEKTFPHHCMTFL